MKRRTKIALSILACLALCVLVFYIVKRVPQVDWDGIADDLMEVKVYVLLPGIDEPDEVLDGPCLYTISSKEDLEKFAEGLRTLKSKSTWLRTFNMDRLPQCYTILVTSRKEIMAGYVQGYGFLATPEGQSQSIWYRSSPSLNKFLTKHLESASRVYEEHYEQNKDK